MPEPKPDSPDRARTAKVGARWRGLPRRLTVASAALLTLWLPVAVGASPPQEGESRFADLPDPDELDLVEPPTSADQDQRDEAQVEPEGEDAAEPVAASSPPKAKGEDDDESKDDDESEDDEPEVEIKTLAKPRWIKHHIIPGERLDEIADRYKVRKSSLIRWNKLDKKRPRIIAGHELAVYTKHIPPPQQKIIYTVKFGDTWTKIADAHHVDADQMRKRWNPKVPRRFKAGTEIVIWVDPLNDPDLLRDEARGMDKASAGTSAAVKPKLPLVSIKKGAVSVGRPNRGRIVNSIALPENKKLYTIRKPEESFGSSHALHNLQLAIANFRQATGFDRAIVIGAISKKGGGRLRPHSSHQSGRDVDVRLPVDKGVKGTAAEDVSQVDWDATWALVSALVATGEVQYIFLSHSRQKYLHRAAKRAGASKDMLERIIQYPRKSGTNNGIVRHARGHTAHMHIRFTCAANEGRCESY